MPGLPRPVKEEIISEVGTFKTNRIDIFPLMSGRSGDEDEGDTER